MIELINVKKEYISKNKRKKRALKDVNLRFPDKGLCVIVGESGSGKTTLLNIIGGLDQKFTGTYKFLNKELKTSKDFSHLRRDHIGFVFQDFNLVEDLTIYDNLDLGTRFVKSESEDKISEVLKKVGLEAFEDRYPSECSGGEQQRITIARTLLKDASVLIADEPSGNLDKKTAVEIFNLFKEISKTKLVIIVTHDNGLAEEFADYKISIEDGFIVENTLPDNVVTGEYEEKTIKTLNTKVAVKMAWHEFARKKVLAILNVTVIMCCFLILSFSFSVFRFWSSDVHYNYLKDNGYEYFNFSSISGANVKTLRDKGAKIVEQTNDSLYFLSRKDAEEFGVKFYESEDNLELSYNIYYMSDIFANSLIQKKETITKGEDLITLDPEVNTPTDLIGAEYRSKKNAICGGIFYSNKVTHGNDREKYYTEWMQNYITTPRLNYYYDGQSITIKSNMKVSSSPYFYITPSLDVMGAFIRDDAKIGDNLKNFIDLELNENEAYVTIDTFNTYFGTNYTYYDLFDIKTETISDTTTIYGSLKCYPTGLGTTINVKLTNEKTGESLEFKKIKIKGIIVTGYFFQGYNSETGEKEYNFHRENDKAFTTTLYMTDMKIYEKAQGYGRADPINVWVKTDTVKNLRSVLHSNESSLVTPLSEKMRMINNKVTDLKNLLKIFSVIFTLVTFCVVVLTISMQVKNRTHELAVFKALGAQNKDLSKIYLFEMFMIAIPTSILSILGGWLATTLVNKAYEATLIKGLRILYFDWVNIPLTICFSFVFVFVALLIPLIKIIKLNVIDAIKTN